MLATNKKSGPWTSSETHKVQIFNDKHAYIHANCANKNALKAFKLSHVLVQRRLKCLH